MRMAMGMATIDGGRKKSWKDWQADHVLFFSEKEASPLTNLGTLGAAGDATATGTRRLVNTGPGAFVWLPAASGNYLSVDDAAALDITDNLEIVCRVRMDDYTPGVLSCIASKNKTASNYSWRILVNTTGTFRFDVSANGTVDGTATSSAPGLTDGVAYWLKFRFAAGAVSFFKAGDADSEPAHGSFTAIGTATMSAGITSIFSGTSPVRIGDDNANRYLGGNVHRFIVRTIGGSDVLDVDTSVLTDEGATSFTATTGQTVTINRGTGTGYRTEVVLPGSGSRLLNGTSDYLEVADNDALDFSAAQSFSVWALIRTWGTSASSNALVSKKASSGFTVGNGYTLRYTNTFGQTVFNVSDGTNGPFAVPATNHTSGQLALLGGVRSVAADQLTATLNDVAGTAATDTTTATLSNTEAVRFGRLSGSGTNYATTRLYAWGIYPGALSSAELNSIRSLALQEFGVAA